MYAQKGTGPVLLPLKHNPWKYADLVSSAGQPHKGWEKEFEKMKLQNPNWEQGPHNPFGSGIARQSGGKYTTPCGQDKLIDKVFVRGDERYRETVMGFVRDESRTGFNANNRLPQWLANSGKLHYIYEKVSSPYDLRSYIQLVDIGGDLYEVTDVWERTAKVAVYDTITGRGLIKYATFVFLPEFEDPGIDRQVHILSKDGEKKPIASGSDWHWNVGEKIAPYTFIYDDVGETEIRLKQAKTAQWLAAQHNSKRFKFGAAEEEAAALKMFPVTTAFQMPNLKVLDDDLEED